MNTVRRCQPLLGTFVEITVTGEQDESCLSVHVSRGFERISEIGALMSFHDAGSELSLLNREAFHRPVSVHPWLWERLHGATAMSRLSDGAFDITIAPRLMEWGLLPTHGAKLKPSGGWRDIHLLDGHRVSFGQNLAIDLGGMAKGFAVDHAMELLIAAGIPQITVNAGGDLRIHGDLPPLLSVRDPASPHEGVLEIPFAAQSAATSAAYFSLKRHRFRKVSHLVDPETGRAHCGKGSVTVFAENCEWADALTKVVLFSKTPEIRERALSHYQASACVLVSGKPPIFLP